MHGPVRQCLKRGVYPALVADRQHFAGIERAENGGVEVTEIFLVVERIAHIFAIQANVFRQRLGPVFCR